MQIITQHIKDLPEEEVENMLNEIYKGIEFFKKTKKGFSYELSYDSSNNTITLKTLTLGNEELN